MRVGRVMGVRLSVNNLLLALLGVCWYAGFLVEALIVFAFLLLHEATHAAVALSYGMVPEEIEMLPFGGISRLRGLMELHPEAEAAIAVVGPVNSLLVAGVAKLLVDYGVVHGGLSELVIASNLTIGLFNLLPLLPLDGGRVARSLMARRNGFVTATRMAASISMTVSAVAVAASGTAWYLGYPGAFPMVAFAFTGIGAWKEARGAHVALIRYMAGKREEIASQGMLPVDLLLVRDDLPIRAVMRRIAPRRYHVFLLTTDGLDVTRQLTELELIDAFMSTGPDTTIGQVFRGQRD